jgi:RecJ-like exonuclease
MADLLLYDDENPDGRALPFKWCICPHCEGNGTSSAYLGAFTGEQLRDDPEFAEDYIAGHYDRACDTCGGSGKVKVVDARRTPKADLKAYRRQQADNAECDRIQRQEMLMEGGWREEYGNG